MKQHILALAATTLLAPAALAGDETPWVADFDEAAALAESQGKDLLVDFTGSDWCVWCKRLDSEVFGQNEFLSWATERYVLTELDFPNGEEAKARVPDPERNAELRDEYGISGFPTILLMTPAGEVYGRTGYQPGGAEAYVEHLEELRDHGKQAMELASRFETAEGTEARKAQLEKIFSFLEGMEDPSGVAGVLADPIRSAFDMDVPESTKERAAKLLIQSGEASQDVLDMAVELDPANESGMLEDAVLATFRNVGSREDIEPACEIAKALAKAGNAHDETLVGQLLGQAAAWSAEYLEKPEDARTLAKAALRHESAIAENAELVARLKELAQG